MGVCMSINIKRKVFIIFCSVIFLYASVGFAKNTHNKKISLTEVDIYKIPSTENLPVKLIYPVRIKSPEKATVIARVTGVLQKKFFKEGSFVKKGQILYKIEPDIYQAEVANAKANVDFAVAKFKKAEKDWARAEKSFKDNVISVEKRDNAKYNYEMARASLLAYKANLKKAEINLNYTNVTAPISGFTSLKLIDVGNTVKPGTPLVTITNTNPVYAEFSLPDIDVLKYKYGILKGSWGKKGKSLKAKLIINGKYYNYTGKVNFVDVNVSEKTSTVKFRAEFPNLKHILMPGQFARVEITGLYRKNIIKVPQKAVLQNPRGTIVFIVKNGKAVVRPVKIGEPIDDLFIVKAGLKPGDAVIVNNLFKIRNGASVKIGKQIGH